VALDHTVNPSQLFVGKVTDAEGDVSLLDVDLLSAGEYVVVLSRGDASPRTDGFQSSKYVDYKSALR
jgi:hypothetical protein